MQNTFKRHLNSFLSLFKDAALEKIAQDQEEFEKEHQFMQVCVFLSIQSALFGL